MMTLIDTSYWKSIIYIPYHHQHNASYQTCAYHFRHSLAELTISDNGTFKEDLFKQIAIDFPRLKTLEIYNNKHLVKSIQHLDDSISRHLPDLHHLCLDRGFRSRSLAHKDDGTSKKIRVHRNMKSIAIRIKKMDPLVIDYLGRKYPCLERLKLTIREVLLPDEKTPPIRRLFKLFGLHNYHLKFSAKRPELPLDIYYKLLPTDEPKSLSIAYTVDKLNPKRYSREYQHAVIELGKNEGTHHKHVAVSFALYHEDAQYRNQPRMLLRRVGKYLSTLSMAMDSIHYALPDKVLNGYFLDDDVFRCCPKLTQLTLRHYSLFSCHPYKQTHCTIQELVLQQCRIGPILSDLSLRLPNLQRITFIDCNFNHICQNGAYLYNLKHSRLESFSILGDNVSLSPPVQIYLDLTLPKGRFIFMQTDPTSTRLEYQSPDKFFETFNPELVCVGLWCESIRYLKICAGSFNVEVEFDAF
ncbi:hypothetical protein K501DRAFT_283212 [Backusella circina FSU 941]|nr:hypothetical protein K501DRAFT_285143 [Backusella circina FSU 941]KAI8887581.1 hypothetical protein K501DRAFT_283212 [Backusella circina FSU 941]